MGNSLQGMFMLGPKPMSFYDSKVKHGLGYTNPYTLKKAISQNPKLYDASCLDDSKIQMNVRDTEDILDDATKSQIKMKKKSQDPIAIEKKQNIILVFRRPSNRDSSFRNNVLSNTKNSSEKVKVSDRSNKKSDVASKNDDLNKKIEIISAKYKLNVHSKVNRALFTTSRTVKSKFEDPTPVVSNTRFSVKTVQSKSLDITHVVSKTKIVAVTPLSAKHKVSSAFKLRDSLGHNLFSVGQFCDGDLEVAFRSKTCYVRNLEGDDLLTGDRESNLYTISISDMAASSPVCLMSKATSTKSWLWHRRLSHLNFGTINDLTKHDLVDGLSKFKYGKDHLCSACERGKSKKASHPPKVVPSNHSKLELLHMDLCGPMRVASINGKRYILVIVDDYSRFTWVYFLRTKDETPEIIKNFIARVQLNYNAKVCKIRTDNGTEFKNATLKAHYDKLGIMQQFSIARTA
ncbi:integrase, catalytic region, zinc finger, CCHC-type containing protein [Tanacetum coccineum]